jgi:hypothetical protein
MVDNITNLNNTNNFSVKSQTEMMTDVGILGSTYLYVHYPKNIQYICTSFRNR